MEFVSLLQITFKSANEPIWVKGDFLITDWEKKYQTAIIQIVQWKNGCC